MRSSRRSQGFDRRPAHSILWRRNTRLRRSCDHRRRGSSALMSLSSRCDRGPGVGNPERPPATRRARTAQRRDIRSADRNAQGQDVRRLASDGAPGWARTSPGGRRSRRSIARGEYGRLGDTEGLQAPNRAHNLRTTFGERGIEVVPRTGKDVAPAWRFAWETSGFGRPGRMQEVCGHRPPRPRAPASSTGATAGASGTRTRRRGSSRGSRSSAARPGEGPLRIVGQVSGRRSTPKCARTGRSTSSRARRLRDPLRRAPRVGRARRGAARRARCVAERRARDRDR